ncbi:MAG: Holliday junction resolvase RuvX [Candidatus Acidiferrales bacterium]
MGPKSSEQSAASISSSARILAIDYGHKRIGLALSDELGFTAQPLAVLIRKNRLKDMKRLRDICERHAVGHIIVGLPIHMTGELSEMADEASRFAARLTKMLKIETEMIDERLTSWGARDAISEAGGRFGTKRAALDDVAAAVLLRDYLEHRRETTTSGAERI